MSVGGLLSTAGREVRQWKLERGCHGATLDADVVCPPRGGGAIPR
jgi:hypothetical protein